MNWFGGDLVVKDINGKMYTFPALTHLKAIAKLKQEFGHDPSSIREAMYYPHPTDLKPHLLED